MFTPRTAGRLAVSAAGTEGGSVQVEGGQLGGLLALKNDLLPAIHTDLDTLAKTVINEVNRIHLQGVGPGRVVPGADGVQRWPPRT